MGKQRKDNTTNKDTIYIKDIDLEYVSTKKDKYDNLVKTKLKPIR